MCCRICGNTDGNQAYLVREMMFGLRDDFTYRECSRCGCLQLEDPPRDMHRYYPAGYYSFVPGAGNPLQNAIRRLRDSYAVFGTGWAGRLLAARMPGAINVLQALQSLRPLGITRQTRILDVGCGAGRLLCSLQNLGFAHLLGIDPYIERDITYPDGLRILKQSIHQVEGIWDVIMFHHSFEHLPDPLETLRAAGRYLREGGICLIRIPTVSSYAWREYRADWAQIDAPRHLFLHSAESIAFIAGRAGFAIADCVYDSTAFQFWASEQYRCGIPLLAETSYFRNPARSIFSKSDIKAFAMRSAALNKQRQGDSAAFYLRKVGD